MERSSSSSSLIQRYRTDRRKIIEFVLRSHSIDKIRTPNGLVDVSHIDLDSLSVDYVLDCVKSGRVVDFVEATQRDYDESAFPIMIHSHLKDSYFLLSDTNQAGSPPRRAPPLLRVDKSIKDSSFLTSHLDPLDVASASMDYCSVKPAEETPLRPLPHVKVPPLGLRNLKSGLSDDNLHESAYEILLASMVFSGIEIYSSGHKRKEKNFKLLHRLTSKKDKINSESVSQPPGKDMELTATVRIQMQISETLDACIRRSLMQLATRKIFGHIDIPQILLCLLSGIFKSDFLNEKSYMQWKNRQTVILEELFCFSSNLVPAEHSTIRSCIAKIRNEKEWDDVMTSTEKIEIISSIRRIALKLSTVPGKFGIQGEIYYWTTGYHLNIRLYERLLFAVFDILDEGQLAPEVDDILMLIKMTWATLGITQKIHDALYGWVFFQQFVATDEETLLDDAISQVQKVICAEDGDEKEEMYIDSLVCSRLYTGMEVKLSLVHAIFFSMSIWCDNELQDYHLHFSQKPSNFKRVITLASSIGLLASEECHNNKFIGVVAKKVESYVELSTKAAYMRVANAIDQESKTKKMHPLSLLAKESKLIAERELTVFYPVLCHWCHEAGVISAMILRRCYDEKLKSFLKGVSCLSEDVRSVLPAADMLDHALTSLTYASEEVRLIPPSEDLDHYQIREISRPLILDWVIAQHTYVLEWTGRTFNLEEWEPLSSQQRQAVSVVEVFRIIEETVDQFFGLNLPMDIAHLQALLSVVFHSLDSYVRELVNQLVENNLLIPTPSPLTRYKETVVPSTKKKLIRINLLDETVSEKLKKLTAPKLCVRLNTLQYIHKQLNDLEDGIRNSWALVRVAVDRRWDKEEPPEILDSDLSCSEAVEAVFVTTFDGLRDIRNAAVIKICEFTGSRVIFWDLRDSIIFRLYHGSVVDARLESILPRVDTIIDQICISLDDTLRDRVVLSIFQSLLKAFVWVLLDGGPSRAFSDSDIILMQDDFNMLKDFFVADGEGLPRFVVAQESNIVEKILSLFSIQTETLIQMLMTASENISLDTSKDGSVCFDDAHTLLRVLCHKKDREASKFLKRQFQLPLSSEYDDTDTPLEDSTSRSPLISDIFQQTASFRWTEKGHSSFLTMKKKLEKAASEIRYFQPGEGSSRW